MFKRTMIVIMCLLTIGIVSASNMQARIEEWQTDEGARVLFIDAPEIPMVDIVIAIDAGSFREGKAYGLASMTADLMTLGTTQKDEHQFSEALENIGSSISVSANSIATLFNIRSLTDRTILNETLQLWKEMITEPRFDDKIFNRERIQSIDAQKAKLDNANSIANETYLALLYPHQTQGVTSEMLQESLQSMTLDALKKFRQNYYHATNANIIIVGDLRKQEAQKISRNLSQILGKGEILPSIEAPIEAIPAQTVHKAFNSPQSNILMGHISINRFDPDYFPLILGNHVLGGSGLTSLLMMDIREKKGLTYGISSYFSPSFFNGPFTIGLATKNENVDDAIRASIEKTKEFIQNGPTDEDLNRAKNNLVGSSILALSSNSGLASALLMIAQYNLPLDYFDTFPDRIQSITKAQIKTAFSKHINPDDFVIVIVGDKAQ